MSEVIRALFSWEFVGPHHLARVRRCRERYSGIQATIFALADKSSVYSFYETNDTNSDVTVAYQSVIAEELGFWKRLKAYARHVWFADADAYFLCHYERPEVFLTAIILRLRLKKAFVIGDSKFDDYQRQVFREAAKAVFYLPYSGALVSGARSESYLRFLGVRGRIETGYDTIDGGRLTKMELSPPENVKPKSYFIVVNRLVKRKNTDSVIAAFAAFCAENSAPIDLVIVGEGPEAASLRGLADRLGVADRVRFCGTIPNEQISPLLANALALLLVSSSEQWGLVVNEAIACGIPVIVSDAVGARDSLVRNFVNGFIVEVDNVQGLSRAMSEICRDPGRLISPEYLSRAATVDCFADAVSRLLA
ncbi:glycosyltransferase [Bradyrhizobium symbiodeficiens]|uniref:glycosyltransferase n=1 Tax=Bradyrhizobium symbiodeficiens TaxID=1404367 RepID=UPI0030D5D27E